MEVSSFDVVSTPARLAVLVLSDYRVLRLTTQTPFNEPLQPHALEEAVYLSHLQWASKQPDHVFRRGWTMLGKNVKSEHSGMLAIAALNAVADEFLESQHGRVRVVLQRFGAWQQSIVSRATAVPFHAAKAVSLESMSLGVGRPSDFSYLPLLTPYDALVEDYIEREGLHETHVHLNGSTHAEKLWLRALREPWAETHGLANVYDGTSTQAVRIQELCHSIDPTLRPTELRRRLIAARSLRHYLIMAASGDVRPLESLPRNYDDFASLLLNNCDVRVPSPHSPAPGTSLTLESNWLIQLIKFLQNNPSRIIDRLLHIYLLLQNQHYNLLVQREDQYGFDQFQKLTWSELRERAEKRYVDRFKTAHGNNNSFSRARFFEGRFAPKKSVEGNASIIHSILGGYLQYLRTHTPSANASNRVPSTLPEVLDELEAFSPTLNNSNRRISFTLVAHFIKQDWIPFPREKSGPWRYYGLRRNLELMARVLVGTVTRIPRLEKWLRGIDAAANELHAPPEIFSVCYRICRRGGIFHRSYHVGEDFHHLVSGIRSMLDALELLDLRNGDRIGHGTAMGILPSLWLQRMPKHVYIRRSEWMLDLLGAWKLMRRSHKVQRSLDKVSHALTNIASQVFQQDISCVVLERAMRHRLLDISTLHAAMTAYHTEGTWDWRAFSLSKHKLDEARMVHEAYEEDPFGVALLYRWQTDTSLWNRSEELIEVDADFLDEEALTVLQQELMHEFASRCVVVETLPSSNVRISQYQSFGEHHALRWMKVPGCAVEGDPDIMVSLGSDDPGIFAGDLSGEFYQLYAAMRSRGVCDADALKRLATLNERGRQYRFHER